MKKWKFVVCMALILALLFQIGCSNNTNSSSDANSSGDDGEKITLTFWDMHTNAESEFFQGLVDEYNSSQDNVVVEYSTSDAGSYTTTKLPTAFANGSGPDIFMVSPGDFMKFADSGAMLDLNPHFPEGAKEDFLPSSLEAVTLDGKVLALPYELELLGLYYNEDMLKEQNIEVPKTWDELQAAAKKLTSDEVTGLILPSDKGPYFNFIYYPFLWQTGGNVLNEGGTESVFNSPEAAKSLDFWGSFFQEGSTPTKLQLGPWEIGHLGQKTAAMQVVGTWVINAIEKDFSDVPINVAPLPIPEGGQQVTAAGGWKMAANAKSEHAEEAAKFIMWAFAEDPERALAWNRDIKFSYSPRKSVVEAGEELYSKGLRKVFTEQIYETAIPEPRYPAAVVEAVADALQNVMFTDQSGADAVQEAHEKINDSLQK